MFHLFTQPKPESVYKTAKRLSKNSYNIWFVMERKGCDTVAVTENDLSRYMRIGYIVKCCFFDGVKHRNAFWDRSLGRYIFTEA